MTDAYDARRADEDDLLAEIGASLSLDPSPGFPAGVRRRVAADGARTPVWAHWWWPAFGLAAGVAVVVIATGRLAPHRTSPTADSLTPREAAARVADSAPTVSSSPAPPVATPARHAPVVARSRQAGDVPRREGGVRPDGPDLVVLTNQPALLRRMWADLAPGAVKSGVADAAIGSRPQDVEARIAIAELRIAPIVIPDVTAQAAPPVSGAGGPGVKHVISAEQSARSR